MPNLECGDPAPLFEKGVPDPRTPSRTSDPRTLRPSSGLRWPWGNALAVGVRSVIRPAIWIATTGICLGFSFLARTASQPAREPARWFVPGAFGFEAGHAEARNSRMSDAPEATVRTNSAPPGFRNSGIPPATGFLTRVMGTVDRTDGGEWARRNGLTKALSFSHHLAEIFPPSLFKTHPEFFPLADGKRLDPPTTGPVYWNPDIARPDVALFAAQATRKYFEAHPEAVSFALGVNDALIWGESPELLALVAGAPTADHGTADNRTTAFDKLRVAARDQEQPELGISGIPEFRLSATKWFRERPDYSAVVVTFMNRVAAELAKTHPDKYVGALAYYWAENAPDFPLHPQVVPFLTADRSQGYDADFRREEFELQSRWAKIAGIPVDRDSGGPAVPSPGVPEEKVRASGIPEFRNSAPPRRLGMYDYVYGHGFLIPRIHTQLLAENLRHAHRAGFTDYYAEVNPNWGLDGPMPWLQAQLLQDPEQSREQLLEEYYRRYFQEAAAPMRRFFERGEEQWMAQPGPSYWLKHYRNDSQSSVFPPAVCRELRMLLEEAGRKAEGGQRTTDHGPRGTDDGRRRVDDERQTFAPGLSSVARAPFSATKVQARVKLVSDTFGVTERFVTFQEARDRLARSTLARNTNWRTLVLELDAWLAARRDLLHYTFNLRREQPLAIAPFDWVDYLKNDPLSAVVLSIRGQAIRQGEAAAADAAIAALGEPALVDLWLAVGRSAATEMIVERNGTFLGPLVPARRIAGLDYGVSLPAEWTSQVEPSQYHRVDLVEAAEGRALRIAGSKDTMIFQWNPVGGGGLHRVSAVLKGKVSAGAIVSVMTGWLDEKQRRMGFKSFRLPDGDWKEPVTLELAGVTPAGAVWVGVGLRVQNQMKDDWIEAGNFQLRVR